MESTKCTACKVTLPIESFTLRRNGKYNKTCDQCLKVKRTYAALQRENRKKVVVEIPDGKQLCTSCYIVKPFEEYRLKRDNVTRNLNCNSCLDRYRNGR